MLSDKQVLVAADSESIVRLVRSAKERLVVLAPAVPMVVAEAIVERWTALGADRVAVTLDVDPEVYRLGYGDPEALDLLEEAGRAIGSLLQCHPGIRIGVVVSDASVLVYSPVPALVEAGPRQPDQPTGILIPEPIPLLEDALGAGPSGVLSQEVGLDKATLSAIEEVQEDLKENPPQKFDVARKLRVFNAAFQFVELSMKGTQIHRRKARIPTYLLGVTDARMQEELTTALQIVPEEHALSGEDLSRKRRRIEDRYLKIVPGYGRVVLRRDKEDFVRDVKDLKAEVRSFRAAVQEKIGAELAERVQQLTEVLLPRLKENPPSEWLVPSDPDRRDQAISRSLEEDLWKAIGGVGAYTQEMAVKLIFRDVTYESLNDRDFRDAAMRAFPELRERLHAEYDAAPAVTDTRPPG